MRALKSVLGQPILRERRVLGGERTTLLDVIARFLSEVKTRTETASQQTFQSVLSGRPVRFHSRNPAYNAQAEIDLKEAYVKAGFQQIDFLPEPEAAARTSLGVETGFGLVVDIGGGTSDYTVFRGSSGAIETVSSHGIRLGGTDFDRLLNIDLVMPRLGLGSLIRNEFGGSQKVAPRALFNDLATWEKIPFQYTPQTLRDVKHLARLAVDRGPWDRLITVLEMELGHEIAHAVEAGKIAANSGDPCGIDLGFIRKGARQPLLPENLDRVLHGYATEIGQAALDAVKTANLDPEDITRVVMVGGSSLMSVIERSIRAVLPLATIDRSDAFIAIVDGLAIAAGQMD